MAELETDNAVIANGHSAGGEGTAAGTFRSQGMWYNQYELTYGLTDRIEAAAYLNMAKFPVAATVCRVEVSPARTPIR